MWAVALLVCCVGFASAQLTNAPMSLSLSSTYSGAPASLCADGNVNTWCASDIQFYPYLDIDFGKSTVVSFLNIYNRQDCCEDRTSHFYVLFKDTPFTYSWPATTDSGQLNSISQNVQNNLHESVWWDEVNGVANAMTYSISPGEKICARYARIIMIDTTPNYLNIGEVTADTPTADIGMPLVISDLWVLDRYTAGLGSGSLPEVPDGWNAVQCVGSCPYPSLSLDLNKGAGGHYIYLFYQVLPINEVPEYFISDILVLNLDNSIGYCPTPWVAPRYQTNPMATDLNGGAGGKYIYLCVQYQLWQTATPGQQMVTGIQLADGQDQGGQLNGFAAMSGDLNQGAGGDFIYLRWTYQDIPNYYSYPH